MGMQWFIEFLSQNQKGLITLLFGGLAGAFVTHYFTLSRQRTEFAFKLLDHFFAKYQEIGMVKGFLQQPESLEDTETYNRVVAIGDWYETVALLCRRRVANERLLHKAGVINEMGEFRKLAENADGKLKEPLEAWKNMVAITKGKRRFAWIRKLKILSSRLKRSQPIWILVCVTSLSIFIPNS